MAFFITLGGLIKIRSFPTKVFGQQRLKQLTDGAVCTILGNPNGDETKTVSLGRDGALRPVRAVSETRTKPGNPANQFKNRMIPDSI